MGEKKGQGKVRYKKPKELRIKIGDISSKVAKYEGEERLRYDKFDKFGDFEEGGYPSFDEGDEENLELK